ncbi:MAG: hypothetical protein IKU07_02280 [Oscillospiraceae bacterium]|nr:hypothetical protein [Oscillospiraceae bacterium]
MKKIKFWILIAVYLLLAFADGALTYINTPDLSLEGNPLVAKLGLGWGALAIANIAVFILYFFTAYYCYFKYTTVYTKETKYTRYFSQIIFDRPDMFWKGAFLLPKRWKPFIAATGFALLYSGIVARLILVLEWLAITLDLPGSYHYFIFEDTYFFGRLDVIAGALVALFCVFYWFYLEFKKQLPQAQTTA